MNIEGSPGVAEHDCRHIASSKFQSPRERAEASVGHQQQDTAAYGPPKAKLVTVESGDVISSWCMCVSMIMPEK
jgi:hypothetical protein